MKTVRLYIRAAALFVMLSALGAAAEHAIAGSPHAPAQNRAGLSSALLEKVVSSALLRHLAQRTAASRSTSSAHPAASIMTAVYSAAAPTDELLARLSSQGVRAFRETWTPPSTHHPLGFFLASVPAISVADVLSLDAVKKMDTAESESAPQCNEAARAIKADAVWSMGITGAGVKVGVLDSGLDLSFAGNELPSSIERRDYSSYPTVDTTVANTATGHGTHVTGIVLSRGMNSRANTANGGGAYKGMAPAAGLAFLKIGLDGSGGATDAAEIAAIHAAVDTFHVKVINLSYGGWDAFHDGSNIVSQTIDWAYSRGTACFVAAGNFANLGRHASGIAPAHDTSGFIEVTVGASPYMVQLAFNLVWSDGAEHRGLSLLYYDAQKQPLTSNTTYDPTFESARGTESQYSQCTLSLINHPGTYYLRVVNPSPSAQFFHLYENYGWGFVQFVSADPNYTISTPGDADHAFTVGAWSAHEAWTGVDGVTYDTGMPLNTAPSFSSRGPRVDGMQKPNAVAPGCMIISLRDRDVLTTPTLFCVDDDGAAGGSADYYVMHGTSMAAPVAAGAAALLFEQDPTASPQQVYDALMNNALIDGYTGAVPNPTYGWGKLNVFAALRAAPLPVELASFTSMLKGGTVILTWRTASERNNVGFEIERSFGASAQSSGNSPAAWVKTGFVPGSGTTSAPHEYSFADRLQAAGIVSYRLKQIDSDGHCAYSNAIEVLAEAQPSVFSLAQNFPNPFNPSTTFRFSVPAAGAVRLMVADVLGRTCALVLDRRVEAGAHTVEWNAAQLPSGVYFYTLEAGALHETKKLLIQK